MYISNSETTKTSTINIHAGEDKLMFIEKPENAESYTLNVSGNLTYDTIIDNNAMLALLIHTDKSETETSATITADFVTETTTNVAVEINTNFTYNGQDRIAELNAHYVLGGEEIDLEYEVFVDDVQVSEMIDAKTYLVKFINVPTDIVLDKTEVTASIAPKELTIVYAN